ncbi:MAG: response regulator [Actinobacteria bacterium]|jgi:CheY-like chemotaxis protein|nr:response regulator [Actinomycetota bacterium]MBU2110903.1 response regulator [Actinomycetota bacterium]
MGRSAVLVVDDDDDFRALVRLHLVASGFEVEEADSGEGALELVETSPPALVLSDLRMGGMDGAEVRERLALSHPDLPVFVWSALPTRAPSVMRKGLQALESVMAEHRETLLAQRSAQQSAERSARRADPA